MEDVVYVIMYKNTQDYQWCGRELNKRASNEVLAEYTPQKVALVQYKPVYRFKIKEKYNV